MPALAWALTKSSLNSASPRSAVDARVVPGMWWRNAVPSARWPTSSQPTSLWKAAHGTTPRPLHSAPRQSDSGSRLGVVDFPPLSGLTKPPRRRASDAMRIRRQPQIDYSPDECYRLLRRRCHVAYFSFYAPTRQPQCADFPGSRIAACRAYLGLAKRPAAAQRRADHANRGDGAINRPASAKSRARATSTAGATRPAEKSHTPGTKEKRA